MIPLALTVHSQREVIETKEQHTNKKWNNVPSQAWPFLHTYQNGEAIVRLYPGCLNEKVGLVTWVLKYYVDKSSEREIPIPRDT